MKRKQSILERKYLEFAITVLRHRNGNRARL